MATSFSATLLAQIQASLSQPVDDISTTTNSLGAGNGYRKSLTFGDGTGALQAKDTYHRVRSFAAGGTEALDLSGVLTDPFGVTLAFTAIKVMYIENRSADETLIVGGAASNGFISWVADATDKIKIPAGGWAYFVAPTAAGYAVTAGTADQLKIAGAGDGSGAGVTYAIVLIGNT